MSNLASGLQWAETALSFQSYPRFSVILGRETRLDLYHIAFIWKLHNMIYDVW